MGAFYCATLTMAPRGPRGTALLDFLTVLERTLTDLHEIDSNCYRIQGLVWLLASSLCRRTEYDTMVKTQLGEDDISANAKHW